MNSQNNRLSTVVKMSLDDVKVDVWYATSCTRVIGSVFSPKTINSHQFVTFWYCL